MTTVAQMIAKAPADQVVRTVRGVVGDALNPVTDAIREEDRLEWIGVRHEEVGAFAASAQAQLPGTIGVCIGTICGQVPLADLGSDLLQEVDNDLLFHDVACFTRTITSASHATTMVESAMQSALSTPGVAVLTLPGDVGDLDLTEDASPPRVAVAHPPTIPDETTIARATELIDNAKTVTMLVGIGAVDARDEALALVERLNAPMMLTLKAKEGLERDNRFQVGQGGLIGNPGATLALDTGDVLLMVGTGHAKPTLKALHGSVDRKRSGKHLAASRRIYEKWAEHQLTMAAPDYDKGVIRRVRRHFDNSEHAIRPEVLVRAIHRHAAQDAVFTSDTGMATVWLSRFLELTGTRRLIGSFNLGSMANAMPQALGAPALDRDQPEQEQGGLPEFGTVLHDLDFAAVAPAIGWHAVRVEDPEAVDDAVRDALAHDGPVLLDVLTNPEEIAIPGKITSSQGWGFAVTKIRESLLSQGDA